MKHDSNIDSTNYNTTNTLPIFVLKDYDDDNDDDDDDIT